MVSGKDNSADAAISATRILCVLTSWSSTTEGCLANGGLGVVLEECIKTPRYKVNYTTQYQVTSKLKKKRFLK